MLEQWAAQWGICVDAVNDLRQRLGAIVTDPGPGERQSEGALSNTIRGNASRRGIRLFRNNVGAGRLENGSFIRWGLCNDSEALNRKVKSHDLVGIRPVLIEPHHVGTVIGQFVSREVKRPGWRPSNSQREMAQLKFSQIIVSLGGDARFTCREDGDL